MFSKLTLVKTLAIVFTLMVILGFFPWEQVLPIQIINAKLRFLTSITFGLIGVLGLIIIVLFFLRAIKNVLSQIVFAVLVFLLTPIICFIVLGFIIPDFYWQDDRIYKNGNDYIVLEEFDGFVTSNLSAPRLVRTKNPNAGIRIIEEKIQLTLPNNKFGGNEFVYKGKTWRKQ